MSLVSSSAAQNWFTAFPIRSADEAVSALTEAWEELTQRDFPGFQPTAHEPKLTKTLKIYIEGTVAKRKGLLGSWSAENVIGVIDPITNAMIEERRTDITYHWNNEVLSLKYVFEFKKLNNKKASHMAYLGADGLGRFVDGIYSEDQLAAAMVGIMLSPPDEIVEPIGQALNDGSLASALQLRKNADGDYLTRPSKMFLAAEFDSEHDRTNVANPITISHIFLGWPSI